MKKWICAAQNIKYTWINFPHLSKKYIFILFIRVVSFVSSLQKGAQFWRTQRDGSLVSLNPAQIKNFWLGLPEGINKIDAVYERKSDSRIVFFIGEKLNLVVMYGLRWSNFGRSETGQKWVTSHVCYILNMVVFLSGGWNVKSCINIFIYVI